MNKRTIKNSLQSVILLITVIFTSKPTRAQSEDCRIRYSYDAAGDRIKREYLCVTPGSGGYNPDIFNPGPMISVFPNPTGGVIHGTFSEEIAEAYFIISAADGRLILSYELMQPATTVTFDISAEAPGTYFLTVWALNREETYKIIKDQ